MMTGNTLARTATLTALLLSVVMPAAAQSQGSPATNAVATPAAPPAPAAPSPSPVRTLENRDLGETSLVRTMQAGGVILVIRHERTEVPSRFDDYSRPPTECMAQRNLSLAGYAASIETGAQLRILNVPIGAVLASPMCRTMDTARLMFNRVTAEPRLMHHDDTAVRTVTVSGAELNAVLAEAPTTGDNTVIMSHIGNIFFAIGLRLSEGEIGVLQTDGDGGLIVLGTITPSELGPLARQVLMERERAAAAE